MLFSYDSVLRLGIMLSLSRCGCHMERLKVLVTCHEFVTSPRSDVLFHWYLISEMISFLHPQRVARGVAQVRSAGIVFVLGFRRSPVAAYSTAARPHLDLPVSDLPRCQMPSPREMAIKQKREGDKLVVHSANALRTLLFSAMTRYDSVEVALLHVMQTHDFNISLLKRVMTGLSILF
jgi:hypothetical protein